MTDNDSGDVNSKNGTLRYIIIGHVKGIELLVNFE